MRRYPQYKAAGLLWVGDIPAHWEACKLKHVARLQFSNVDKHTTEGEVPVRLCNYTDVYYHDTITEGMEFMRATASPEEIEAFALRGGDVLITKDSEMWDDIGVPAYVPHALDGVICGYHLAQIRPDPARLHGKFLFRALQAVGVREQFHVAATGVTRFGLSQPDVKGVTLPVPPLDEQAAIVDFLDGKLAEIDRFVANKRRLIELLQEERRVTVSHVVIGCDKAAPGLGGSGDSTILPAGWSMKPVKRLFKSMVYGLSDSIAGEGLYRVLTMGHIQEGRVLVPMRGALNSVPDDLFVEPGDLLFNRTNSLELVGKVGLFRGTNEDRITFASYLVRLRPAPENVPEYLNYLLNSHHVLSLARAEAVPSLHQANLNPTRYGRIIVPVPPRDEQLRLVARLDAECSWFVEAINRAEREIELIQEYRTALIADAVTGKIDCRP